MLAAALCGCADGCTRQSQAPTPTVATTPVPVDRENHSCASKWRVGSTGACVLYPGIGWACLNEYDTFNVAPEMWASRGRPRWQGIPEEYRELVLGFNLACGQKENGQWACAGVDKQGVTGASPWQHVSMQPAPALSPQTKSLTLVHAAPAFWLEGDKIMRTEGFGGRAVFAELRGAEGLDKGAASTTCAWTPEKVLCWGTEEWVKPGGSEYSRAMSPIVRGPVTIKGFPADVPIKSVAVGRHACALTDRGKVYCFGSNSLGQWGVGRRDDCEEACPESLRTAHAARIDNVVELGASAARSFALKGDGKIWSWGGGYRAQRKDTKDVLPIHQGQLGSDNRRILVQGNFACVVKTSGALVCWGSLQRGGLLPLYAGDCDSQWNCGPVELFPACIPLDSRPPAKRPSSGSVN